MSAQNNNLSFDSIGMYCAKARMFWRRVQGSHMIVASISPKSASLGKGTFPAQPIVGAYDRYGSNFRQCIVALKHINLLRLIVYGCRRNQSGVKYLMQFYLLNRSGRKRAH